MDFISNQLQQTQEMLKDLNINQLGELWSNIPKSLQEPTIIEDDGLSELEGYELLEKIASKNKYHLFDSYIGAGAYSHYVPAIVNSIIQKAAFLTAYTPYQPEVSQGLLQTIFEFQTAICRITGLDLANASLYDGSSACAEALLMTRRVQNKKRKLLVAGNLHPHYFEVVKQYLHDSLHDLLTIPITTKGTLDFKRFEKLLDDQVAGVLLPYPNFFGFVEDLDPFINLAKEKGALVILSANPLIFGLYRSGGELGADIVVGDCQPFGIPLQFGGPYAGYMSCKKEFVRQIPGRVVGKTKDLEGNEGFVLTLQTREQHIRREKATSNICTNQALCALASLVSMLWYGKEGFSKLALTNFQRTQYLKTQLNQLSGVEVIDENPVFNEFTIKIEKPLDVVFEHFHLFKVEPGLKLEPYFPQMPNHLLINVTEMKNLKKLDNYIKIAKQILR